MNITELSISDLNALQFQLQKITSKWGWKVLPDDPRREEKLKTKKTLDLVENELVKRVTKIIELCNETN